MKKMLRAELLSDKVMIVKNSDNKDSAELIVSKNFMGSMDSSAVYLSNIEALYLLEKGVIQVFDYRMVELDKASFLKRATKKDKDFPKNYVAFSDLRSKGYFLRPALKYGADFAVYGKGDKPGKSHSKWLLFVFSEEEKYSWKKWVANNRVAHSVKKNALLAIIDSSNDITYYETSWLRP